jgi:hypothetical protein
MGIKASREEISAILSEIDLGCHGQLELQDYLQVDPREEAADQCLHIIWWCLLWCYRYVHRLFNIGGIVLSMQS